MILSSFGSFLDWFFYIASVFVVPLTIKIKKRVLLSDRSNLLLSVPRPGQTEPPNAISIVSYM